MTVKLAQTLVKSAYEHRENIVVEDAVMSVDDDTAAQAPSIPKEDMLKLKINHLHHGHAGEESDSDDKLPVTKANMTSISCLFSAFENRRRLLSLGQLVEESPSQKSTAANTSTKPTDDPKPMEKVASTVNKVDIDMDPPASSSLPDAFGDIDMPPSSYVPTQLVDDGSDHEQPAASTFKKPTMISRSMAGKGKVQEAVASSAGHVKHDQPRSIDEGVISPGRRPSLKKRPRLNTAGERPGRVSDQQSSEESGEESEGAEEEDDLDLARSTLTQP
ncbi:hypothetical protein JVT61DRAFT_12130 [Boletus reticuloceps]|uniref:Uncharacterized protein n=1 Tax=Boletus reticuloceps TaxID=495285 RepID=A0A8I2YEK2_9AGAM|nr:hypothetical protein JVT61DRAFT_12130 [Boletus reticuloceps]